MTRRFVSGLFFIAGSLFSNLPAQPSAPYLDPSKTVDQRVDDLISRMTLEEKVSQIIDDWGIAAIPRLQVPALLKTEGLHSHSYSNGGTLFPHAIALAASWDIPLAYQIGQAIAVEAKASGVRQSWSPVLDVARDARWGRVEETFGEDPYLVSRMGVSWIKGFQSEGMIATPKHFAGHGTPLGGRDSNDIGLSDRVMREVSLVPFRLAILEGGAGGIMAAYGVWNGVPDNASQELLQGILHQEWGFDGLIVTDCSAIEHFVNKHSIVENYDQASRLALEAGVNMECGPVWKKYLMDAIQHGVVSETLLDRAVRVPLATKFRLGLFEHPGPPRLNWDKLPAYDTPEHRALARQLAEESIVLLKNDNKTLPLSKNLKTIAVIGPNAAQVQTGDYSAKAVPGQLISVLDGIKSHVSPGTKVIYAQGYTPPMPSSGLRYDEIFGTRNYAPQDDKAKFDEAVEAAKQADVVVMVMGDSSANGAVENKPDDTTGENNDGATLELPGPQLELIKAVQAVGKPVVLTLVNGKPFVLTWEQKNLAAILVTWYAGEEAGNATADILFGDKNPSGRLPITFPRHVGQLPLTYDYKTSGRGYDYYDMLFTPLYRFGFGLSYTTFKYSNLRIDQAPNDPARVTVKADIQNTGTVAGDEVAQLYVTDVVASVTTPVMELKGFNRVSLAPGETKTVTFQLQPHDLSLLDVNLARVVEPGVFRIHVGGASPTLTPRGGMDNRTKGEDHKKFIRFENDAEGVSGDLTVTQPYAAKFVYSVEAPAKAPAGADVPITVTVKNEGDLTDVTVADLYFGKKIASWHFEIEPGKSKSHTFNVPLYTAGQGLLIVTGSDGKVVSHPIVIAEAPAKMKLTPPQVQIDETGNLTLATTASNVGSQPFSGKLPLTIDGKVAQSQPIQLGAGESKEITFRYAAEHGGNLKFQLGDLPAQNITIPGGVGLAWGTGPILALPLRENGGSSVKDTISGHSFAINGVPQWQPDALHATGNAFIPVGSIDLANRSFTLAAWVKLAEGTNRLGLFGGSAPMGAGQDASGSRLHAGVQDGKAYFGFFGRDVSGNMPIPVNQWVFIAFVYDAAAAKGTIYINGNEDARKDQLPYAGALETIGTSPMMQGGDFELRDVAVIGGALGKDAVQLLAQKGVDALRSGSYQTEWRPLDGAPQQLEAWLEGNADATVKAVVETANADGKVLGSKDVSLTFGKNELSLKGLAPGSRVRVRLEIAANKWNSKPLVRGLKITGEKGDARWATEANWRKGASSGGVQSENSAP
jgi:beta-glucosidase